MARDASSQDTPHFGLQNEKFGLTLFNLRSNLRSFLTHAQYVNPANWDLGVTR